jgi:hypothetical protein
MSVHIEPLISFIAAPRVLGSMKATTIVTRGVVQGLKKLFADESFVNLLRAEGLDTLPKYLSDRISAADTSTNTTPQPELEGESA